MVEILIKETSYRETMEKIVEPYLNGRKMEFWLEREPGQKIYAIRYLADNPRGVVLISHGFTETAEKYQECVYYFLKKGYQVYVIEHCGHGHSYRLTEDNSLVHVDKFERYVDDLLFAAEKAKKENAGLPLYLYAHSMGGGIGAAAAAKDPGMFKKLILTSPMIRPATGGVPWPAAKLIAKGFCLAGKKKGYVVGQKPYDGQESFQESASMSEARFDFYQKKRESEEIYQMNAASYGWLAEAGRLNRWLRRSGWKQIQAPVLLFQAETEDFVSVKEQERFIKKLSRKGNASLIRVPQTKHEIYQSGDAVLMKYWNRIFTFLEK